MKRLISMCLLFCVLAGCGWPTGSEQTEVLASKSETVPALAETDPDVPPYFAVEFLAEENYLQDAISFPFLVYEDRLLCYGDGKLGEKNPQHLFWTDFLGETKTEIPLELQENQGIRGVTLGADGTIYLIISTRLELEETLGEWLNYRYEDAYVLMLDETGQELGRFSLAGENAEHGHIAVGTEGEVYVIRCEYDEEAGFFSDHYLEQYSPEGELLAVLGAKEAFPDASRVTLGGMLTTPEGEILLRVQINDYDKLYRLSMDPMAYTSSVFAFEDGMEWPDFYEGKWADYYVKDDNLGFIAYSLDGERKTLFHIRDVASYVPESAFMVAELGEYQYLFGTYLEGKYYFFTVTGQWEPIPETEKTVLTIGSFTEYAGGSILQKATLYNILHSEVELRVKMYSVDENGSSVYVEPEAANEALQMDILNGEGPDILILDNSGFLPGMYAGNGYLTDLAPLMNSDDTFIKEDYFYNLWESASGTVSHMPLVMNVMTMVTAKEITGDGGWTPAEALKMVEETGIPLVCFGDFLKEYALGDGLMDYIDGNTCNFVDGEFAAMLELIKSENPDSQMDDFRLRDRSVLGEQLYIHTLSELLFAEEHYGGYAINGIPNPKRETMNVSLQAGVGIAETCENKEIAWDFIRMMLDTMENNHFGFSVKREDLMEKLEAAMLPEEDPDSELAHSGYAVGAEDLEGQPLTQEQCNFLLDGIESASPVMVDPDLKAIVQEECEAFFAGDKSAEEVAELVQSRVMIYLSERS